MLTVIINSVNAIIDTIDQGHRIGFSLPSISSSCFTIETLVPKISGVLSKRLLLYAYVTYNSTQTVSQQYQIFTYHIQQYKSFEDRLFSQSAGF